MNSATDLWSPAHAFAAIDGVLALDPFDYEQAQMLIWRVPHHGWRTYSIMALSNRIPAQDLNRLLAWFWGNGAIPPGHGPTAVVEMFKAAGFVTDTDGIEPPAEALTVYRGCGPGGARSLSWTTELARAEWFARRCHHMTGEPGAVYVAAIAPRHVLGIFHERNEAEVVVNPRGLSRLRLHGDQYEAREEDEDE